MNVKVITVGEKVLGANEDKARENKNRLDKYGVLTINIMSSPGAGKTSLILNTIKNLRKKVRIAVIEGDVASSVDAEKVNAMGIPVIQINTGGGCHLDAFMVEKALDDLPLKEIDLLFIENVGNLICPATLALGEHQKVVIASIPEGDDKPAKYPVIFTEADAIIINKLDMMPYFDFDLPRFKKRLVGLNPKVKIFEVSCKTGDGIAAWCSWLSKQAKKKTH